MKIIRTGKGRVRNMLHVKVVCLTEDSWQDWKYWIGPVSSCESVGGMVCDRHQNIFNLMSSLRCFTFVIFLIYLDDV